MKFSNMTITKPSVSTFLMNEVATDAIASSALFSVLVALFMKYAPSRSTQASNSRSRFNKKMASVIV